MMITIKHASVGFNVKCSPGIPGERGFVVAASNIDEVHKTIDHYIGTNRAHSSNGVTACPLCVKIRRHAARQS